MSGELTKKAGVIGISRLVATSVNVLIVSMFLSRYLDQTAYGTFQQTWFFTHMCMEIAMFGFPVGILYFAPKLTLPERKGFFLRITAGLLGMGALLGLALYLGAPFIARTFQNPALEGTFRTFALYAFFLLPSLPMDAFLITQNRHGLLSVITLIHSTLIVAAVLIPAAFGAALSVILWCATGYGLVRSGLVMSGAASTMRGVQTEYQKGLPRKFIAYSFPIGVSNIMRVASRWLDKNIVSAYFTPETFAIYANGAVEIPFVGVLASSISSVILPEFSRLSKIGDTEGLIRLWHRAIVKTGALLIPLFAFLMVLAPSFLVVLFSERYLQSATPFRIYLLLIPLRCAAYTPILLALGRSKLVMIGALIDVLVNLGLSILLIPKFSYLGPAIATVLTTYGQAAFYLWWTARILSLRLATLFPWRSVGQLLFLSLLPIPLLFLLLRFSMPYLATLAAGAVIYFVPALLLLWNFGPLSESDRELIRGIARKLRF